MIEVTLLNPSKETPKKLRWSAHIQQDNAPFHLYIPEWRVPTPWPGRIYVGIALLEGDPSSFIPSPYEPNRLEKPIRVLIRPVEEHTRTVRYAPLGDQQDWQIGQPYIPYSLIPAEDCFLIFEVHWDLRSRGEFVEAVS